METTKRLHNLKESYNKGRLTFSELVDQAYLVGKDESHVDDRTKVLSIKEQVAKAITKALEATGMTKYRLRAESEVSMTIINNILRCENYQMSSLEKIAKTLGIEKI